MAESRSRMSKSELFTHFAERFGIKRTPHRPAPVQGRPGRTRRRFRAGAAGGKVASTAARSETPNGRACPRLRLEAVRRYPASTRAVRSPPGVGCPASFARKYAAATAIEALEEARPARC